MTHKQIAAHITRVPCDDYDRVWARVVEMLVDELGVLKNGVDLLSDDDGVLEDGMGGNGMIVNGRIKEPSAK